MRRRAAGEAVSSEDRTCQLDGKDGGQGVHIQLGLQGGRRDRSEGWVARVAGLEMQTGRRAERTREKERHFLVEPLCTLAAVSFVPS